jgi:1-acyl-sn-glycerol-3-phosphate acyltransferase
MVEKLRQLRPETPLWRVVVYEVSRLLTAALMTLIYRFRAYGSRRIPRSGPLLLVANHQSFLDPPAIGLAVHTRQLDYIARIGLFHSRAFSRLLSFFNALPIREEGGDAAAIREILRRLEKGHALLIFPEGSRTEDGATQPFKRGVALLVKRARCPVVPVAVEGCFDAWPRWRRWPRLWNTRIAVAVGTPIAYDELMAQGPDAALDRLAVEIEQMRLVLRRQLRRESRGRFPAPGPGDHACSATSTRAIPSGTMGTGRDDPDHPGAAIPAAR